MSIILPYFGGSFRAVDRNRFDTLAIKLFFAIAGAIAALTLAAWFVFSASFERGFLDYLRGADDARLEVMVDRLEETYTREGGWDRLVNDRDRWVEMSRDALGIPRTRSADAKSAERRDTPLTIDPRLLLFDANRKQLIGRPFFLSIVSSPCRLNSDIS